MVDVQPVLVRDLGWLGEKLGEFRYPPYDLKALGFIRNLLKNRYRSIFIIFKFVEKLY